MNPHDLATGISFLRANLVWSNDFDQIREPLADLLEQLNYLDTISLNSVLPTTKKLIERITNGLVE